MRAAEQLTEVVDEAVAALVRLDADQLEAIEMRLLKLVRGEAGGDVFGPQSVCSTEELTARLAVFGRCVAMTAENLQVLERLRSPRTELAGLTLMKARG